jgi:hypothetical protein
MGEGWLPPAAPGGRPPARWQPGEPAVPAAEPVSETATAGAAGPPTFVRPAGGAAGNREAVIALVCGIVGLGVLLGTAGLAFLVSLPVSVAALVYGRRGRRAADEAGAGHRGMAQAGWVLGLAGLGLGVVALVGWGILLSVDASFLEDLEQDLDTSNDLRLD